MGRRTTGLDAANGRAVYQKSKRVWEAVGEYTEVLIVPGNMRETIRVTDRSETAALRKWIETARYRGQ